MIFLFTYFPQKNYQNSILIVWTTILWITYFVLWACFSLLLREPRRLSSSLRLSKCISKKKLIINVNCNDRYSPLIHHIKETCPVHKRSPFSSSYWRDSIKVSPPPIPCWQSLLRLPDIRLELDILFCFLGINVSWGKGIGTRQTPTLSLCMAYLMDLFVSVAVVWLLALFSPSPVPVPSPPSSPLVPFVMRCWCSLGSFSGFFTLKQKNTNLKGPKHSKNENFYFLAPAQTKRMQPI